MLSASIYFADIGANWEISGPPLTAGQSGIEIFRSSQLSWSTRKFDTGWLLWIGEVPDPFEQTDVAKLPEACRNFDAAEGIYLIFREAGQLVEMVRTCAGNCPIYLARGRERFIATWRFEEAVSALDRAVPDVLMCQRYIADGMNQVRDQIIAGVQMLWPAERALVREASIEFEQMPSPLAVMSAQFADRAVATEEFLRLVAEAMSENVARANGALVELSGGLDSSCVAFAAALLECPLNSCGVIHTGPVGAQQSGRRNEIVELCRLRDFTYPAAKDLTYQSLALPGFGITPFDEMYRLQCSNLLEVVRNEIPELDLVLTGMGGDELVKDNALYRAEYEVAGYTSSSAVVAAACRSDLFMRLGIWPKSPLISKPVVDFCRALPGKIREDRQIHKLALVRAGVSDAFLFPRYYEHFGYVSDLSARNFDFDDYFSTSAIHDWRIYDIDAVLHKAREATLYGFTPELRTTLFFLCKLEAVLRSYV